MLRPGSAAYFGAPNSPKASRTGVERERSELSRVLPRPLASLRSILALLVGATALAAGTTTTVRASDELTPPPGCVAIADIARALDCTVPVPAGVELGLVDTRVRIIVPDDYGTAPVPTVYLLHGVGDTYRTWVQNTDVETFAPAMGTLVVMPDGGHTPDAGWYSDWIDGSRAYETFHIDVLIPWIDSNFLTLATREHRAVMGNSMGGFGALSYAARHPETFGAAASMSGLIDTQQLGPVDGVGMAAGRERLGTPDARTWGDSVTAADEWSAHNPTALARAGRFAHLEGRLWLTSGTGTPGGPAGDRPNMAANYGIEHYIWHTNQRFKLAMTQAGSAFHDRSELGGIHDWPEAQHAMHVLLPDVIDAID